MLNKKIIGIIAIVLMTAMVYAPLMNIAHAANTWNVPTNYATISAAITGAAAGDTITVSSGVYNEQININKKLTIIGAGAATTIITGTGKTGGTPVVTIDATADVSFSGFTITGAPFDATPQSFGMVVKQTTPTAGVTYTISDCKFVGTNNPADNNEFQFYETGGKENVVFTRNVVTQYSGNAFVSEIHTGATEISYCTFDAPLGNDQSNPADIIFFMTYGGNDVTTLQNIAHNTFNMGTACQSPIVRCSAISICAPGFGTGNAKYTNVVITANTIDNYVASSRGIGFWSSGGNNILGTQVTNNYIYGTGAATTYGIDFYDDSGGTTSGTTITGNTITGVTDGIFLRMGDAPGTEIHNNNIYGNTVGVSWLTGAPDYTNATYNWWGAVNGPKHTTSWTYLGNPYGPHAGSGDIVTDYVLYNPYLTGWPPALWVGGNTTLYGPCLKTTTFPIDVNLFSDNSSGDIYAFDFTLTWPSTAPITLQSVVVHPPWASGQYFIVANTTTATSYHLAMEAMPPGAGLQVVNNVSLVTLTFHIDQDVVWGFNLPIPFTLTNNGMSGDGTTVTQLNPEVDNGLVTLVSVEPEIGLTSPDLKVDNSTGTPINYLTANALGVTHTVTVFVANATDMFGFYVDLQWSSLYKNASIQKVMIDPNFPPPYEYLSTVVTPGELKIDVVRPCEKAPLCGANVNLFSITFTETSPDQGNIPTPVNTTISIVSAYTLSKDSLGHVLINTWQYSYTNGVHDPNISWVWAEPLSYLGNIRNVWNPKRADITLDGKVDIADLSALAKQYGKTNAWDALTSVGDTVPNTVNIFDFVYVAKHFGDP